MEIKQTEYPVPQNLEYFQNILTKRSRLIRLPEVLDRVGISRSSIYSRISDGTFPAPIKVGARSVAWLESAIDEWISDRLG